jgi:hypothetical protein
MPARWQRFPWGRVDEAVTCEGCERATRDPHKEGFRWRATGTGGVRVWCARCFGRDAHYWPMAREYTGHPSS